MPRTRTLAERFWPKVDKRGPNECWEWKASCRSDGYGCIGSGGRGTGNRAAHRVSWELANGPLPEGVGHHGAVVMHTCDNRKCVNPAHLRIGTQLDNVRDAISKGTHTRGSRNGNAILDETDVRLIRFLRSVGARNHDVADWFRVSPQQASNIAHGSAWQTCQ